MNVIPKLPEQVVQGLLSLLSGRFSMNASVLQQHGGTEAFHAPRPPQCVCFAETETEVVEILRIAHEFSVPVIPFGAGTSLEGHVAAEHGGICLDLSRMKRVIDVRADDLEATIEPGVTRQSLDIELRDKGLFFPVDPGAHATIGGMAATRASGTNSVRYGTIRENVRALRVVLADGKVITTGCRARKSAAGYDLTKLFVGSEGTLGIITQLTVALHPIPERVVASVVQYPTVEAAVSVVQRVIQLGIPVARAELMDAAAMRAFVEHSGMAYELRPTVFFEFAGSDYSIEGQIEEVTEISEDIGGGPMHWARDESERKSLWNARHQMHYAILAQRPGAKIMPTDVCVPISRLAECITETQSDTAGAPFFVSCNGHVGDGNFHLAMLIDATDDTEIRIAREINRRLVARSHRLGGTCSGQHGIGLGKREFMQEEHGLALEVMSTIKLALDPKRILNPGKILP